MNKGRKEGGKEGKGEKPIKLYIRRLSSAAE